ncbi:unnamed protein product [marine sediment metagenome]|uniref:Uncharacterized protein n=1 Tax=marine sediment metagenome TaxID=412755 RepID=X1PXV3_9ZZZZ
MTVYINGEAQVGVTTHAALTDVNTPHLLAELEAAVCSETEADNKIAAATMPIIVRKTADKTLNNVDTLENDNHLLMAIGANEVWQIDIFILCYGNATPDIQFGMSYPVGCLISWGLVGAGFKLVDKTWGYQELSDNKFLNRAADTIAGGLYSLADSPTGYRLSLIVINGANAGNINLQWAQNIATVADTTVVENSCLIAHQLA